jgi:hypothetical protein
VLIVKKTYQFVQRLLPSFAPMGMIQTELDKQTIVLESEGECIAEALKVDWTDAAQNSTPNDVDPKNVNSFGPQKQPSEIIPGLATRILLSFSKLIVHTLSCLPLALYYLCVGLHIAVSASLLMIKLLLRLLCSGACNAHCWYLYAMSLASHQHGEEDQPAPEQPTVDAAAGDLQTQPAEPETPTLAVATVVHAWPVNDGAGEDATTLTATTYVQQEGWGCMGCFPYRTFFRRRRQHVVN